METQILLNISFFYKIYFFNENVKGNTLYGRAREIYSKEVIVLAPGLDDTTCAHELFHALGLYHSFSDLNQHTFEEYKTDNVMDYSDVCETPIPVVATWQFQWDILHENLPTIAQWKENKRKEKTNQQITKR
ncbi:hypothetical protein J5A68_10010 [Prevotella melaninogenica]|uniref:hypothetical protein n=1 Tax=Prevotella melaninogenica TaxID=28132 RepID=UPI001BABF3C1|nr:hypothetical protein [Prevotella melaninogenica]QUB70093.1 hypothetical protein J5A68_10010 [Prevotella melaninogenica]